MRPRNIGSVVAGICVLGLVAACGSNSSATSTKSSGSGKKSATAGKQVIFIPPVVAPVWNDAVKGFEAEAKKYGMSPTSSAPNGVSVGAEVQTLSSAISSGARGIAFCPEEAHAFDGELQHAKSQGIPVVTVDCPVDNTSLRISQVGTVGQTFGAATAQHLLKVAGNSGQVVVFQESLGSAIANQIFGGFKGALSSSTGWKIVAHYGDNDQVSTDISDLNALFKTHPGITYVYCIEANCPAGAVDAITSNHLQGKVHVIGIDNESATLNGIRSGIVSFSAAQPFTTMGKLAADYLAWHFEGKPVPRNTDTGVVFIDKSNVDTPTAHVG